MRKLYRMLVDEGILEGVVVFYLFVLIATTYGILISHFKESGSALEMYYAQGGGLFDILCIAFVPAVLGLMCLIVATALYLSSPTETSTEGE